MALAKSVDSPQCSQKSLSCDLTHSNSRCAIAGRTRSNLVLTCGFAALTPVTDPLNIPSFALDLDGNTFHTTVAKALDDLAEDEAKKRAARRRSKCGNYRIHEDLQDIATHRGSSRHIALTASTTIRCHHSRHVHLATAVRQRPVVVAAAEPTSGRHIAQGSPRRHDEDTKPPGHSAILRCGGLSIED
jgi:hypothetical protein